MVALKGWKTPICSMWHNQCHKRNVGKWPHQDGILQLTVQTLVWLFQRQEANP